MERNYQLKGLAFMGASLNKVIILGNLGQDPELRHTQSQAAVCTLNVATTEYRTGQDGVRQEFTDWHRVVVWNRQAENCAKYLAKGRSVMVEGRLQTRSWEDKQGQKRYTTEIIAQSVQFVGSRERGAVQEGEMGSSDRSPSFADEGSYGRKQEGSTASLAEPVGDTPGLDDIPF
jgi:single-strand DNA-binding protein